MMAFALGPGRDVSSFGRTRFPQIDIDTLRFIVQSCAKCVKLLSGSREPMDFNRFTEKLQEGVRAAQSQASRRGQQQLDVEHLLVALLEQEGGLAQSILAKADVKLDVAHQS